MSYVRYSPEIEVKQPNEDELIDNVVTIMSQANQKFFDKHRHAGRDAHAKMHGGLVGHLEIYDNLPPYLSQGIFTHPAKYPVVIRLSSAPFDIVDDRVPAPHGMAVKVIGIPGSKLLVGQEDELTQDFVMISDFPIIPFGDIQTYWQQQQLLEELILYPAKAQEIIAEIVAKTNKVLHFLRIDRPVIEALSSYHNVNAPLVDAFSLKSAHILGKTFYSMAPIRYGDYVAKISVAPLSRETVALVGQEVDADSNPSIYRDLVVNFFHEHGAEYELRVQLCTDLKKMPVEDASIEWPEDESPYQPVAKIVIPKQEAYSPERRIYVDDILSFTPWHAIPEHQPLGSLMRARIKAYETSSKFRHKMNAVKRVEPRDIKEIPD
jgi:hypothetical protein